MDSASGRPRHSHDMNSRIQELEKQVRETRLLKESIEDRLRFEKLLFEISTAYSSLPAVDVEKNIRKDQERISKMLGADRCTLSQISKNKNGLNFLYAWADKGLPAQDDTYLETHNYFPWCMSKLKRGKDIIFKSLDELPDEAAFDKKSFTYLSVQAHISVPIKVGGEVMYCFFHFVLFTPAIMAGGTDSAAPAGGGNIFQCFDPQTERAGHPECVYGNKAS